MEIHSNHPTHNQGASEGHDSPELSVLKKRLCEWLEGVRNEGHLTHHDWESKDTHLQNCHSLDDLKHTVTEIFASLPASVSPPPIDTPTARFQLPENFLDKLHHATPDAIVQILEHRFGIPNASDLLRQTHCFYLDEHGNLQWLSKNQFSEYLAHPESIPDAAKSSMETLSKRFSTASPEVLHKAAHALATYTTTDWPSFDSPPGASAASDPYTMNCFKIWYEFNQGGTYGTPPQTVNAIFPINQASNYFSVTLDDYTAHLAICEKNQNIVMNNLPLDQNTRDALNTVDTKSQTGFQQYSDLYNKSYGGFTLGQLTLDPGIASKTNNTILTVYDTMLQGMKNPPPSTAAVQAQNQLNTFLDYCKNSGGPGSAMDNDLQTARGLAGQGNDPSIGLSTLFYAPDSTFNTLIAQIVVPLNDADTQSLISKGLNLDFFDSNQASNFYWSQASSVIADTIAKWTPLIQAAIPDPTLAQAAIAALSGMFNAQKNTSYQYLQHPPQPIAPGLSSMQALRHEYSFFKDPTLMTSAQRSQVLNVINTLCTAPLAPGQPSLLSTLNTYQGLCVPRLFSPAQFALENDYATLYNHKDAAMAKNPALYQKLAADLSQMIQGLHGAYAQTSPISLQVQALQTRLNNLLCGSYGQIEGYAKQPFDPNQFNKDASTLSQDTLSFKNATDALIAKYRPQANALLLNPPAYDPALPSGTLADTITNLTGVPNISPPDAQSTHLQMFPNQLPGGGTGMWFDPAHFGSVSGKGSLDDQLTQQLNDFFFTALRQGISEVKLGFTQFDTSPGIGFDTLAGMASSFGLLPPPPTVPTESQYRTAKETLMNKISSIAKQYGMKLGLTTGGETASVACMSLASLGNTGTDAANTYWEMGAKYADSLDFDIESSAFLQANPDSKFVVAFFQQLHNLAQARVPKSSIQFTVMGAISTSMGSGWNTPGDVGKTALYDCVKAGVVDQFNIMAYGDGGVNSLYWLTPQNNNWGSIDWIKFLVDATKGTGHDLTPDQAMNSLSFCAQDATQYNNPACNDGGTAAAGQTWMQNWALAAIQQRVGIPLTSMTIGTAGYEILKQLQLDTIKIWNEGFTNYPKLSAQTQFAPANWWSDEQHIPAQMPGMPILNQPYPAELEAGVEALYDYLFPTSTSQDATISSAPQKAIDPSLLPQAPQLKSKKRKLDT